MKNLLQWLLPTAYCLLLTFNSFAFTNYVWSGGSETAPYDTWAKAAHNIQDAVNSAVEGNVVLVTNDTYTVSSQIMIATNNIILKSVNGAKTTAINGNSTSHCIYLRGDSVIDGFSILNGKFSNGGGIFVHFYGTVLNCIFTNNIASFDGGAIRARDCLVSNCYFYANEAMNGGGVFMLNYSIVKNCVFENNHAITNGGAVYCDDNGVVSDCIISSNSAFRGGGAHCKSSSTLSNCTISGNSAIWSGGGARCYNGGAVSECTISGNSADYGGGVRFYGGGTVSHCTISGNSADYGGGVNLYEGGSVSGCTISGNSSIYSGGAAFIGSGGSVSDCTISENSAKYYGGGVRCYTGASVSGCTISSNSAKYGGGASCDFGGTISECTINGNIANIRGGGAYLLYDASMTNCLISGMNTAPYGGGVYLRSGGELYNCAIAGNNASDSGGGICTSNGGTIINTIIYDNQAVAGNENWFNYASGAAFSYCCTIPISGLPGGNGCITNNPEFVTPGSDYHLQALSPCRNSGSNMVWMATASDLDGNPRLTGGTVDMGCYEFVPEPGILLLTLSASLWLLRNRQLATPSLIVI